jgi:CheY-like chemotaxis protein
MARIRLNPERDDEKSLGSRARPIIVLAEDDEETRRVYGIILRSVGYRVVEATCGEDAVEMTRSLRPNLVLMDIGLPGLDGRQASRILKLDPETKCIPVIAFSAVVDSTADLGSGSTFDGFILKPVSPMELVRRIAAYLALLDPAPTRTNRNWRRDTFSGPDASSGASA